MAYSMTAKLTADSVICAGEKVHQARYPCQASLLMVQPQRQSLQKGRMVQGFIC